VHFRSSVVRRRPASKSLPFYRERILCLDRRAKKKREYIERERKTDGQGSAKENLQLTLHIYLQQSPTSMNYLCGAIGLEDPVLTDDYCYSQSCQIDESCKMHFVDQ
jgi:hypothetical protein